MDTQNLACFLSNSIVANTSVGSSSGNGGYVSDLWKSSGAGGSYATSPPPIKSTPPSDHLMAAADYNNFNGFSLSPIDFDPLPSLFSFGPCSSSFKDFPYKEKPTHDLADVLLSLKHAVVHPGQLGPLPPLSPLGNYAANYGQSTQPPATTSAGHHHQMAPASVSFSVHPPAPQHVSPSTNHQHHLHHHHHHLHGYQSTSANAAAPLAQCGQTTTTPYDMVGSLLSPSTTTAQSSATTSAIGAAVGGPQAANLYPSMSVNVSMNVSMMEMPGMAGGGSGGGSSVSPFAAMMAEHHLHQQQQHSGGGAVAASHHPQWSPSAAALPPGYPATSAPDGASCYPQSHHHQNLMHVPLHVPLHMTYNAQPPHHHHHHHHGYGAPPTGSYSFTAEFRPEASALQSGFSGSVVADKSPVCSMRVTAAAAAAAAAATPKGGAFGAHGGLAPPHGVVKKRAGPPASCKGAAATASFGYSGGENGLHAMLHGVESDPASVLRAKVNLCRICGKTYARPSTLKTHMRTHSGEKPYRCATCHKSFSQAANLTAHVRTHSGEKPFRCPICARRFSQSSSVTTHMRTHSGERPYRCRMCKKAFSDSSTLTKHLRIHSGEKPYQCKLCLLRFSQSGNLNRHMRVHVNPI